MARPPGSLGRLCAASWSQAHHASASGRRGLYSPVAGGRIGHQNALMVPDARPAGRWEPAELGVHPVIGGPAGSLPAYIRRPHDEQLRRVLDPEVADSRLVLVRGEACAGKSRAAYEAVA